MLITTQCTFSLRKAVTSDGVGGGGGGGGGGGCLCVCMKKNGGNALFLIICHNRIDSSTIHLDLGIMSNSNMFIKAGKD